MPNQDSKSSREDVALWLTELPNPALYYYVVPVITALFFTSNGVGIASELAAPLAVLYWFGVVAITFGGLDLLTRVGAKWMPMRASDVVVVGAAAVLGTVLLGWPLSYLRDAFMQTLNTNGEELPSITFASKLGTPLELLRFLGLPIYWIGLNLVFVRLLRYPVYLRGRAPARGIPAEQQTKEQKTVVDRHAVSGLASASEAVLLAQADNHNVRLRTQRGERSVRQRFSDFLSDLPDEHGTQIHRSIWVAFDFIDRVDRDGAKVAIITKDGQRLPVSRSHFGVLKRHHLL